MNDLIVANSNSALIVNPALDGWADTAADYANSPIKGSLLKCNDGQWLRGKEAAPLNGQQFVAMAVRDVWTKWEGGKPSEYLFREPGKPMAERKELGDLDQSQWEPGRPEARQMGGNKAPLSVGGEDCRNAHFQHDHHGRAYCHR
jgi:hypothetical protein